MTQTALPTVASAFRYVDVATPVTDNETGNQLEIDNKYIMSPKDLKSVRFIDKMMDAGVRVFKIEGRARGPEYVHTVVSCYKEAIESVLDGTFTEEKKDKWDERLNSLQSWFLGWLLSRTEDGRMDQRIRQQGYREEGSHR